MYTAARVFPAAADPNGREPPDWTGTTHTGVRIIVNRSDNPANVFVPDARRVSVAVAQLTAFFAGLSNDQWTSLRAAVQVSPVGFAVIYSGSAWVARRVLVFSSFLASDKQTLVGQLIERLPDDTEVPLPNARIFFEATNLEQTFGASKSDTAGGYIAILETGAEYTIAGSNELACKVYEIVEIRSFSNHTDIVLRVPVECRIPEVIVLPGEPIEDLLNKEIGFHDYEPVKVGQVVRAQDDFREESAAGGVNVAVGAEATILDITLAQAISIQSILVGADGDAEFRFLIGEVESLPRRQTKGDVSGDNLLDGFGALYANTGTRLRVFARNITSGTPANAITARASILGRKYG